MILLDTVPSPVGPISLAADARALVALEFGGPEPLVARLRSRFGDAVELLGADDPLGLSARVRAYLAGELAALADVPVDGGGTAFQRRVWAALREVPAGGTASYAEIASRVGAAGFRAARAVGLASARNPIAIAVPCHRVVGADGSLTGYAGGLERKRWLLAHERARGFTRDLFAARSAAP
ncbi:MAG TPA: methylated-DNA--[protein]-cysteine S-methyltransferase [Anaeromyxobacter sp.]|nr:methylated-DNA--[protein]-cysteine S-methyltransferase [Anaeromyxobacter sp.]